MQYMCHLPLRCDFQYIEYTFAAQNFTEYISFMLARSWHKWPIKVHLKWGTAHWYIMPVKVEPNCTAAERNLRQYNSYTTLGSWDIIINKLTKHWKVGTVYVIIRTHVLMCVSNLMWPREDWQYNLHTHEWQVYTCMIIIRCK